MGERRDQQLQIRVTGAEKAALRAASARAGMGMSEWVLARLLPPPATRLISIIRRLQGEDSPAAWAEAIDVLQRLGRLEFRATVDLVDPAGLSPLAANYLAALVEMRADQLGCTPPPWTARIDPLDRPHFGTDLRRLREHLLFHAPVAFRRRNIFVDASVGDRV
ncbi:hypothetical protein L6R50_20210 [Myxococcota bacterium]|nr:hypothetical protein [Myxococcota bacterium]